MKKTLSIHLGKQLFVIEEDAHETLQHYLQRLESSFNGEEGIAEIIEDIEMRFAELLMIYLGENRKVVTQSDIEKGIASLGEPESIHEDTSTTSTGSASSVNSANYGGQKRFFRDTENGLLGGVAAGISAYFNLDPVIVRILLVIFAFVGFGIPMYLLLWVIIPSASSPSDRLQMHGKPITAETLKEEFVKAASRVKNDTLNAKNKFQSGNDRLVKNVQRLTTIIRRLVGIFLLFMASIWSIFFILTISGIIDFIPATGDLNYLSLYDFLQFVIPAGKPFSFVWSAILIGGISLPIIGYIVGLRLLAQKTLKNTRVFIICLIVACTTLTLAIMLGIVGGLQTSRDFAVYAEVEQQHLMFSGDELIVDELPLYSNHKKIVSSGGLDFIHIEHGKVNNTGIFLTYRPSKDTLYHIYQIVSAHGTDKASALKRSTHIQHRLNLTGQHLNIDPNYYYTSLDGFRDQEVEIVIEIPNGKKLKIKDMTFDYPNSEYTGKFYANEPYEVWE